MRLNRPSRILLIISGALLLTLAGCVGLSVPSADALAKARSSLQVPFTTIQLQHINASVYLLLAADQKLDLVSMLSHREQGLKELGDLIQSKGAEHFSFGLAFAIDHRGYLLTAAHCVEKRSQLYLIGQRNSTPLILQARVIHALRSREPGTEIALLRTSEPLDEVLPLAPPPMIKDDLYAVSWLVPPQGAHFAKGQLLKTNLPGDQPALRTFETTIPLWHGDSGGPLLDSQARVVGINTGGYTGLHVAGRVLISGHWHGQGISCFPTEALLTRLLNQEPP